MSVPAWRGALDSSSVSFDDNITGFGVLLLKLAERRLAKASLYDQAVGDVDASVLVVVVVLFSRSVTSSTSPTPASLSEKGK